MSRIVCKFGGSSLANSVQFQKVKAIVESDSKRRIVVPSAPGKQNPQETKVTDLLYTCHELAHLGEDFKNPFELIQNKFGEIQKQLGLKTGVEDALDQIREDIKKGKSKDYVASRGEYLCGKLLAEFLGAEFVDPLDCVFIGSEGQVEQRTYESLAHKVQDEDKIFVMPGYYGSDGKGEVKTFSRGGSDISGSIAARAIHAELYENWTDVSGLLMTDPGIVHNPKPLKYITYREIRELAYMGAKVFHDQAIEPVRAVGIPIQIKNTNRPQDLGTTILKDLAVKTKKSNIAGIAGIKDVILFNIEKNMMNREKGFGRRVLEIFERYYVSYEHSPTGIDSMNVLVTKEELKNHAEGIQEEIQRILQPDKVTVMDDLSLIATVGEGMQHNIGTAAKLFTCLKDAKINVRIIDQGSSELNIIIGVNRQDYEKAIQALYHGFVE